MILHMHTHTHRHTQTRPRLLVSSEKLSLSQGVEFELKIILREKCPPTGTEPLGQDQSTHCRPIQLENSMDQLQANLSFYVTVQSSPRTLRILKVFVAQPQAMVPNIFFFDLV